MTTFDDIRKAQEAIRGIRPIISPYIEMVVSVHLPFEDMYWACDLSTRNEFLYHTDAWTHAIEIMPGKFVVSQQMIDSIQCAKDEDISFMVPYGNIRIVDRFTNDSEYPTLYIDGVKSGEDEQPTLKVKWPLIC